MFDDVDDGAKKVKNRRVGWVGDGVDGVGVVGDGLDGVGDLVGDGVGDGVGWVRDGVGGAGWVSVGGAHSDAVDNG